MGLSLSNAARRMSGFRPTSTRDLTYVAFGPGSMAAGVDGGSLRPFVASAAAVERSPAGLLPGLLLLSAAPDAALERLGCCFVSGAALRGS